MKLQCPISGTIYTTSSGYGAGISPHPIFSLKPVQLLKLLEYSNGDHRTNDDTYLLGVALLHSLPTKFDAPVEKQSAYPHLLHNWDSLVRVAYKIDSRYLDRYPRIIIDKHTATLSNLGTWLENYEEIFRELATSQHLLSNGQRLARKEAVVESLLASPLTRNKNKVASLIADWADVAGRFPTFKTTLDDGSEVILSTYWKHLIMLSVRGDHSELMAQPGTLRDFRELIAHCEDEIPHGTVIATNLMSALRNALAVLSEFDPSTETVRIVRKEVNKADPFRVLLDEPDSLPSPRVEHESELLVSSTNSSYSQKADARFAANSLKQPQAKDFSNSRDYLKAMLAFKRAQKGE